MNQFEKRLVKTLLFVSFTITGGVVAKILLHFVPMNAGALLVVLLGVGISGFFGNLTLEFPEQILIRNIGVEARTIKKFALAFLLLLTFFTCVQMFLPIGQIVMKEILKP